LVGNQQVQIAGHVSTNLASSLELISPGALKDNSPFATEDRDYDVVDSRLIFQSGTDLITPISTLERQVYGSFGDENMVVDPATQVLKMPAPFARYHHLTSSPRFSAYCARALRLWNEHTQEDDIDKLRTYISTYSVLINKHCK